MTAKPMKRVFQCVLVGVVWIYLMRDMVGIAYQSDWFHIIPILGIIICALSIFMPKKWSMGINRYNEANIIERVSPLVFSIGLLLLMGRMNQTYTVVIVETFFFANSITYIAWLISDFTVTKLRKFLGMKG